ncbi:MAG TPA: hypothetical protein DCW51_14360 [Clostridium sp.]|nr:hypothetical protein [Clostridium sp.]
MNGNLIKVYRYIARIMCNSQLNAKETEKKGAMLIQFCNKYFEEYSVGKEIDFQWFLDCVAIRVFNFEVMKNRYKDEELLDKQRNNELKTMLFILMEM